MCLVTISFFGTLIWDRIVLAIFAPRIFKAMLSEVRKGKRGKECRVRRVKIERDSREAREAERKGRDPWVFNQSLACV